ncbi:MAG: hypothetical protein ACOVKV_13935, partial [Novosphingobium sp.]
AAMTAEVSARAIAVTSTINLMPVLPCADVAFPSLQGNSLKWMVILSSDLNMSRDMFSVTRYFQVRSRTLWL